MVHLASVTSTWRDSLVSYSTAVPSWSTGLKLGGKTIYIEHLFFNACKLGVLWIVESLILAGIARDKLETKDKKIKNTGLHLAVMGETKEFHAPYFSSITRSSYTPERHAVIEDLLNPNLVASISNRQKRKLKIKEGPKVDPYRMIMARNSKNLSAFDIVVENGLEEIFDLMFPIITQHLKNEQEQEQETKNQVTNSASQVKKLSEYVAFSKMNPIIRVIAKSSSSIPHQNILKKMIDDDYFFDWTLLQHRDGHCFSLLHHAARFHNHQACKWILEKEEKILKNHKPHNNNDETSDANDDEASSSSPFPDDALYAQNLLLFSQDIKRRLPLFAIFYGDTSFCPVSISIIFHFLCYLLVSY